MIVRPVAGPMLMKRSSCWERHGGLDLGDAASFGGGAAAGCHTRRWWTLGASSGAEAFAAAFAGSAGFFAGGFAGSAGFFAGGFADSVLAGDFLFGIALLFGDLLLPL